MQFLPALLVAFSAFAAAHVLPERQTASHALEITFPLEIELRDWETNVAIGRPIGIVAGFDTTLYVVTASGQIFLTDIKNGKGTILNPGGDDQRFAGVCLDSRGPGTLYATGGDSGLVFAFNRRGELLQRYQITGPKKDGGKAFLANCIQTRYQLLITDANNPVIYYLELVDEGPLRGHPSVPNATTDFQGVRMEYEGDWEQVGTGFNAYGVEWSQKFNETAYVMNSATGQLFTMGVMASKIVPVMEKVEIEGNVKLFPGALFILFDSTNENVLYISLPHLNAVAVLEVSREMPRKAKFVRYLMNVLIDGPVAIGEYGDWIYPISGHFKRGKPRNGVYTIVRMPRHEQIVSSSDPDEEFTTFYDDKNDTKSEVVPPSDVQQDMKNPPPKTGKMAPALLSKPSADNRPPERPGTEPSDTPQEGDDGNGTDGNGTDGNGTDGNGTDGNGTDSAAPATPTETPIVASSNAPAPAPAASSNDDESNSGDRPSSIFGAASLQPVEEESRACFPGSALVRLESGLTVQMSDLMIGDQVMSGWDENDEGVFSDVFMFSHQNATVMSFFISIKSSLKEALELSPGHYMYINGKLATAANVRRGDVIGTYNGEAIRAESVRTVRRQGLYNPQTLAGDIVVSGLQVSTYTSALDPVMASALMSPLRAAHTWYRGWSVSLSSVLAHGSGRILELFPRGRPVYL